MHSIQQKFKHKKKLSSLVFYLALAIYDNIVDDPTLTPQPFLFLITSLLMILIALFMLGD